MKNKVRSLSIIMMLLFALSCGLKEFKEDLKKDKNESIPVLTITDLKTTGTESKTSGFKADGYTSLQFNIALTPASNIVENRKVILTTSIGGFIVGGDEKKTVELILDELGRGVAYIKSPGIAGSGIITASSSKGIARQEKTLAFEIAEPETVIVETPTYVIRDSSSTPINISLTRGQGNVSDGQKGVFQLLDGTTILKERVSFIESSSSKDGKASCKMILEKISVGKYKIKANFGSKSGEREIEVVRIESPKITK